MIVACATSAVPTAPRDIVIKTPRQGEMHIRWKPPLQPNGIVTHYYVRWQPNALSAKNVYDLRDYCGTWYCGASQDGSSVLGVILQVGLSPWGCILWRLLILNTPWLPVAPVMLELDHLVGLIFDSASPVCIHRRKGDRGGGQVE